MSKPGKKAATMPMPITPMAVSKVAGSLAAAMVLSSTVKKPAMMVMSATVMLVSTTAW